MAHDARAWRSLAGAEQVDMAIFWEAMTMNAQWDAMLRKHRGSHHVWECGCWISRPWTEAEKAMERRRFQGFAS